MEFEVLLTEPALADLERACVYIAQHDSVAAEGLREGVLRSIGVLQRFPYVGASYESGRTSRLREIGYRTYRIFYEVFADAKRVEVHHIRHGRMDEPTHLG